MAKEVIQVKRTGFPNWARQLFERFLNRSERLEKTLRLSIIGIHMVRGRQDALKVLSKYNPGPDDEKNIRQAERDRADAELEVESDFPLLHAQAAIALWSSLEALVRSFLAQFLAEESDAWKCEAVAKLKVKLGDFMSLGTFDRSLWIVDLVDQEAAGPLRNGVKRFESLLEPFGLDGEVAEQVQKDLYELSQVRHALVHRYGVADRKLVEACPWLPFKQGEEIALGRQDLRRYATAVHEYVLELVQRTRVFYGDGRFVSDELDSKPDDTQESADSAMEAP